MQKLKAFIIDYCQRHAHPLNAALHILGVPMAFTGLYYFLVGHWVLGMNALFWGYVLQYIGHRMQGNEVGEITLIKHIWKRLKQSLGSHGI